MAIVRGVDVVYLYPWKDGALLVSLVAGFALSRWLLTKWVFYPLSWHVVPEIQDARRNADSPEKQTLLSSVDLVDELQTNGRPVTSGNCSTVNSGGLLPPTSLPESLRSLQQKFFVSSWRAIVYTSLVSIGYSLLHKEPFFSNTAHLWYNWPQFIEMKNSIKIYYLAELAYYVVSFIFLYSEPKMRDRVEMTIHHVVTIALISASYVFGFWKVGILIMFIHDVSDPLLEIAKLLLYMKAQRASNLCVTCFAAVFLYSRLYIYPRYLLWSTIFEAPVMFHLSKIYYYPLNTFLIVLQVLHIFWGVTIVKLVYVSLRDRGVKGDPREQE